MKISDFTSTLPYIGKRSARQRLNEIFSRQMLGAVLVGSSASKIVEKIINLVAATTFSELIAWTITFFVAIFVFVYWERLEHAAKSADDSREKAKQAVSDAVRGEGKDKKE